MGKVAGVALDSNCYSYLLDALNAGEEPRADDPLQLQKLALVRTMFYDEWGLYLPAQVVEECGNIGNPARAQLHESWRTLFPDLHPMNSTRITERTAELLQLHKGTGDCRMVAECEDSRILVLLTYDGALISKLSGHTQVRVIRPSDYWSGLNIPKGATAQTEPSYDNPLAQVRWWRWE